MGVGRLVEGVGLADIDLQNTIVRAPRAGKLSEVSVRVGQLVSPGTQLMYLTAMRLSLVVDFGRKTSPLSTSNSSLLGSP